MDFDIDSFLANFELLGWYAPWGERWYDVPIYNSVVDDLGFDPLFTPPGLRARSVDLIPGE